ncbi:unnamed protein product [Rhodiola kirilowii]
MSSYYDIEPWNDGGSNLMLKMLGCLPQFGGTIEEDPVIHCQHFHHICRHMKPKNETLEEFKLKCFKFSLIDSAIDWYYSCAAYEGDYGDLRAKFLEEFSPPSLRLETREKILNLEQSRDETLDEYYSYFDTIVSRCPHHGFTNHNLIQRFLAGMTPLEWKRLNDAAGGSIMKLTMAETWDLIDNLAESTKQGPMHQTDDRAPTVEVDSMQNEPGITSITSLPATNPEEDITEAVMDESDTEISEEEPTWDITPEPSEDLEPEINTVWDEEKPSWELTTEPTEDEDLWMTEEEPAEPLKLVLTAEAAEDIKPGPVLALGAPETCPVLTTNLSEKDPALVVEIPQLVPSFSGTHRESATTHLQRLHGICQNLKPNGVNVEGFKLKAFYFSLIDSANDWFLSLPSRSIRTWAQMQKKFLDKYYPAGRAMQVRRQLQDIKQGPNETMYDYLEKFNRLERSCRTLGLPEKLIIEYLIDGLRPLNKMLLDASAGGSMMNLSLSGIRNLITDVAENARFREETTRQEEFSRTKNVARAETSVNSMPEEMKQIKEMMVQILRRQPVQINPCQFCSSTDHKTDACPTLIVEEPAEVNAVVGYQGYNNNSNDKAGPSRQYGQATNPSWRNNSYPQKETQQAAPQLAQSFYQPPHRQYNQNAPPTGQYQQKGPNQYQAGQSNKQGPNKWLEDMMKELQGNINQLSGTVNQLSATVHQNQAKNDGSIADLKKQMSQLATSMSALTIEPSRLPSQTIQNPKENVSAVTLRSGRKLAVEPMEQEEDKSPRLPGEEQMRPEARGTLEQDAAEKNGDAHEEHRPSLVPPSEEHRPHPVPKTETSKIRAALPFPVPA